MSTLPPEETTSPSSLPTHLLWAVLATVASMLTFCILGAISGIVAIVYALLVNRRLNAGDSAGAGDASHNAKVWCWITTCLILAGLCVVVLFVYSGGWAKYQQIMEELGRIQLHG
ncbi:CD225/dispanin family protein [Lysobacter sp. S4-A87]|uniref:CD225/dispanin family protein n=1 Tax=Lysobacter sp. S4-A87 TaxID=2925843 RepID=UPI001F539355|nr:CD225/dispanin family protein [Lysobacter sp. S4-A87]UNK51022.1 CD225/dispanin family protein [Lysobacter sp. S4-A87]